MKSLLRYLLLASTIAGALANPHQHLHRRARKNVGSRVERRNPDVTETVVDATETVYQLNGKLIDAKKAKAGLAGGDYVIIGDGALVEAVPSSPAPSSASDVNSKVSRAGGQFLEKPTVLSLPARSSQLAPASSSTAPEPVKSISPKPSGQFDKSGTGLDKKFPDGTLKCSEFPSQYGAIALDYLQFGGWAGLQRVPDYSPASKSIVKISNGEAGQTCSPQTMCSYACPPGYQKTQWPEAQGSTKQSVGGIFCNANGFLELTRKSSAYLCELGAGGVTIRNDLDSLVSVCRTDYPGTENMVIPTVVNPGQEIVLTNPVQYTYYSWDGKDTSAQYYVNMMGMGPQDACVWGQDGVVAGNWAPVNIGVGKAKDGNTYIGLFQNSPTSDGATLNFDIVIEGDVSKKCSYKKGTKAEGCTATLGPNGKAVIRFK